MDAGRHTFSAGVRLASTERSASVELGLRPLLSYTLRTKLGGLLTFFEYKDDFQIDLITCDAAILE